MKTERRHQLESNLLISKLGTSREWVRPYAGVILGFIALVLAGYVAVAAYSSYRATQNTGAWDEYQMAVFENDGELKRLQRASTGGEFDGSDMHEWAYVTWADRQLRQASFQYLSDRAAALDRLTKIEAVYKQYADNGEDPEIRNRARLGLARVKEMQNKPEEALAQYELVKGPLGELAAERIEKLKLPATQEDLKWLATVDLPKPTLPAGGRAPGTRPGLKSILPPVDAGELQFDSGKTLEEIIGGMKAAEAAGRYDDATGAPPAAEGPAVPGETPAAEQPPTDPAPTNPATTDAAPTEPASTDAPAAEQPAAADAAPAPAPAGEAPAEAPAADAAATPK